MERLENETHPARADCGTLLLAFAGEIFTEQEYFARAGLVQTRHQSEQRGLAGARGTLNDDRLLVLNIQRYIIYDVKLAIRRINELTDLV